MISAFLSIDTNLLHNLYAFRTMPLTYFFIDISEFGRWQIVFGIAVVISLCLILSKRYVDIIALFSAIVGSSAFVLFLKYSVQRPRPEWWYQAYLEGPNYSFPSAHAAMSMALYGFCIYLLLQSASTRARRYLTALLPILIFLVAFSRLYLGVHYLSDVIAGLCIGAFFVYFAIRVRLQLLTR